jgi:hypothetical protein
MLGSLRRSQSISTRQLARPPSLEAIERTLLAGFAFNLAKMFCDCVFVASAMSKTGRNGEGEEGDCRKGDSVGE